LQGVGIGGGDKIETGFEKYTYASLNDGDHHHHLAL
jgi:hypothetical protein